MKYKDLEDEWSIGFLMNVIQNYLDNTFKSDKQRPLEQIWMGLSASPNITMKNHTR